jgi:5-deoxy-glucuronate isomerase
VSRLLVRGRDGSVAVTPASAGWDYVGFEAFRLDGPREIETGTRELCLVLLGGRLDAATDGAQWPGLGGRADPFDGLPHALYVPPRTHLRLEGRAEIALCFAPAERGVEPRAISPDEVEVVTRGSGAMERRIHNILMAGAAAESLLVTEVLTPAGHWSSYPPHKHDREAAGETYLEETYYHRLRPARGFGLQRVYTDDGSLDESVAFGDGDVVLVPRGYHTVSAPPGYELYYLNVMAGPRREWKITNDPAHEWLLGRP